MSVDKPRFANGECGENAAPYVLGALTEGEHEAFARHLASCAVCREEVDSLQMVAASLPATAPQVAAPPELKQRVMSEVYDSARRARENDAQTTRERSRRARPRWRPVLVTLGAGLVAILALAIVLATGGGGGAGEPRLIRAHVTAPGASASVLVSDGRAQLALARMPQVRPGRVYEVWVRRAGAPAPTDALFTVAANGDATVAVPGSIAGVKELLVTSEPLGGSRVPTTSPVIVAKIT
jgi:anti-sigma-K factor RskA